MEVNTRDYRDFNQDDLPATQRAVETLKSFFRDSDFSQDKMMSKVADTIASHLETATPGFTSLLIPVEGGVDLTPREVGAVSFLRNYLHMKKSPSADEGYVLEVSFRAPRESLVH